MSVMIGVSAAAEWREKVAELRAVAEHTDDPQLRGRLFALAEQWDEFAGELEIARARWPRR